MAEPQDSIFVTIDAQSKSILFEGSKALFNTQLHNATAVVSEKINEIYRFDLEADVEGIVAQLEEEMTHAKSLHKMYAERDDIVFVNLCCSSKANNWVKAIEKSEIGGENYLVESDDAARMILSAFELRGYPSYMLVDKDGEIVTTSAFRPSQLDKLSEQLDRLL